MPNVVTDHDFASAVEREGERSRQGKFMPAAATDDRPKAQGFPLQHLPEGMRWLAAHMRDTAGFPVDYFACAMLFSLSVATGTALMISPKRGWVESVLLWLILLGRPGSNKTHPLSWALRPIYRRDAQHAEAYRIADKEYQAAVRAAKQTEGADLPPEPVFRQHLIGDTTPEALTEALKNNPRGLGTHRDEIAGKFHEGNRYNNGGETERELTAWSLQPHVVNRKKDRKPIRVERPFNAMCGTLQPGVMGVTVAEGRGVNGHFDRTLYAYPENGSARQWSEAEPDMDAFQFWDALTDRVFSLPTPQGEEDTPVLRFTPDAQLLWKEHHDRLVAEVNKFNSEGDEARAGYRTKLIIYSLRLALLLTVARWAEGSDQTPPSCVDSDSLRAAIALVDYFASTADRVLFALNEATPVDKLTGASKDLLDKLNDRFRTSEAVTAGLAMGMSERTVKGRLNKWTTERILNKEGQGIYSKRFE